MSDLGFILALSRPETNAGRVTFIPETTIEQQYIKNGRYIVQRNRMGCEVGYLLHGSPRAGGLLRVEHVVIDYDLRQRGHGMDVLRELINRAIAANCRGIYLRCADDNPTAHELWSAAGFERTHTIAPANKRKRTLGVYTYDLWPVLWSTNSTLPQRGDE